MDGRRFGGHRAVVPTMLAATVRCFGLLLAASCLLWGSSAWAQEEVVNLDYRAERDCPSRKDFERQVRARTSLARFVDDGPSLRRFVVVARQATDARAVGYLTITRGTQEGTPREVTSDTCRTVVSALALVTALAIDPQASTAPILPTAPTAPASVLATPPTASSVQPPPSEVRTAGAGDAHGAAHDSTRAPSTRETRETRATHATYAMPSRATEADAPGASHDAKSTTHALWAGVHGGGWLWFDDKTVAMGQLAGSLEWEMVRPSAWSPSVRVSLGGAVSSRFHPPTDDGASVQFTAMLAQLGVCPLRLQLNRWLSLRPCLGLEGGALTGDALPGRQISTTQSATRAWWATHQTLQLQLDWGRSWRVELAVGVAEPLVRDIFLFEVPPVTILRVPAAEPIAALGLAHRFW